MTEILISLASNPYIQTFVFMCLINLYNSIKSFKEKNKNVTLNDLIKVAIAESSKLVNTDLSNDEKRNQVIEIVYNLVPEPYKKSIKLKTIENIVEIAYDNYVKEKKVE